MLKEKVFPGDTYTVAFEARKTNPASPHDSHGIPQTVASATVTLLDGLTGLFIALGGGIILSVSATVVAPTGATSNDLGSVVSYMLPSSFTLVPGDFTLFVRCVCSDGSILTEDRRIKVNEFR